MPEDNNNQPIEPPQIVVGSSTEPQFQVQPTAQPVQPIAGNHKVLKAWLLISLVILALNTGLLLLTLVPLIGVYIAIGAAPILLATGLLALVNLFIASRALFKKYFMGGFRKVVTTVLVLSVVAVLGGLSAPFVLVSMHREQQKSKQITAYYNQQDAAARSEATVEQATQLLNSCQVFGFYYTHQDGTDGSENAEKTSTGILLYKMPKSYDGTTTPSSGDAGKYRVHIADRMVSTMVPIARNAQHTCGIQFWHDGTYEQYKDGKWYFKGEVVQDTDSGRTKEEAISFMQNCKADYFVGYTDINLVKDASTKEWLNKAEQSSTGIEISEGSTKSYVFASKAMTTALQDTARQFRQSCYGEKKLYIAIDNWIETEYPAGKWTRVNQ